MFAIIVPFRQREQHLKRFLPHMNLYLHEKGHSSMSYRFLIVEQSIHRPFNRGKLLNIGYVEAVKAYHELDFVVLHDVDMLPMRGEHEPVYEAGKNAIHMATKCSQFGYKMPYADYFGGVNIFTRSQFEKVNGYSNEYWGWGAEDDDLRMRCERMGVGIERRPGLYQSLPHPRPVLDQSYEANVKRMKNMQFRKADFLSDGINSLAYSRLHISNEYAHYNATLIKVNV